MQPTAKFLLRTAVKPRGYPHWRRFVSIVGAIALFIILFDTVMWPNRYLAAGLFGEGIYKVETSEKIVALTFDDGPDPRYTAKIGQILKDAGAKGTFFVIGRHAEQHPEIVQTLIAQGHEIGNHTWNHPSLRMKPPHVIRDELESTDYLLHELGYRQPIPFRSPYGHSWLTLPYVLKQRQQPNILWTVQMDDWKPEQPDIMMQKLSTKFSRGAIILMHDGDGESEGADRQNTVTLVQQIVTQYGAAGYQFVTVSELLARGRPILRPQ